MSTQQSMHAFVTPKHTLEKRHRETPPTHNTSKESPENKAFRPNNTTPTNTDDTNDKKRKARGRRETKEVDMTDAAEVNETHPQQEQTIEKTERTVIKIKKKKKKLKDKKFTSQRSSKTETENKIPAHEQPRSMEERNEDIEKINEQPTIREYKRNGKDKSMNHKKTKEGTDMTETRSEDCKPLCSDSASDTISLVSSMHC